MLIIKILSTKVDLKRYRERERKKIADSSPSIRTKLNRFQSLQNEQNLHERKEKIALKKEIEKLGGKNIQNTFSLPG